MSSRCSLKRTKPLVSSAALGLYVHIPFCSVKCFYCDFTAFSGQGGTARRYLAVLEAEARLAAPYGRPSTLYVGGGTPSELSAGEIEELFNAVERAYPEAEFRETTFEANPESLDARKLKLLRERGVTRLSLGLQTLDDHLLKAIGRRHTAQDFFEVYRRARELTGLAVNVDLMYGLPGQTLEACLESLDGVLGLEPEHVSLYGLQVEDRTLFAKRQVESDEDLEREMFEKCLQRLERAGLRHYEISNFARPGFESIHNLNYWHDGEYTGLGCGAASYIKGERSTNIERLIAYMEAVEKGVRPVAESECLSGKEKLGETIFLGLRLLEGLDLSSEMESQFKREWESLAGRGLIRREGSRARLTREGVFLANQVFAEFVPPFEEKKSLISESLHALRAGGTG